MKAIFFYILYFFLWEIHCYIQRLKPVNQKVLWMIIKIFALAKCITSNYEKMGVDFTKLPLKDNTMGFIDIDAGLAFLSK